VAALAGCGGKSQPKPVAAPVTTGECRVTAPGGKLPRGSEGFNYGNGSIGVALWPHGELVSGPLADGSSYADTQPDGSIRAKLGWFRGVEGQLRIEGQRLDGSAPPLRADIPAGYGPSGFQATLVFFPTQGCWKVTGSVGDASLAFVVRVSA
jgi:hypothetical protein